MPSLEEIRTRLVRARGFIRAAETVFTDTLADVDAAIAERDGQPDPDPTPDPEPDPDPVPDPDPIPPPSLPVIDTRAFGADGMGPWDSIAAQGVHPFIHQGNLRQTYDGVGDRWTAGFAYLRVGGLTEVEVQVRMRFSPTWDFGQGNGWIKGVGLMGPANAWFGFVGGGGSVESRVTGPNYDVRPRTDEERFSINPIGFTQSWVPGFHDLDPDPTVPMIPNGTWFTLVGYANCETGRVRCAQILDDGTEYVSVDGVDLGMTTGRVSEIKIPSITLGGGSGIAVGTADHWIDVSDVGVFGR